MMLAIWLVSSCQKETPVNDIPGINKTAISENATATPADAARSYTETAIVAQASIGTACSVCDANTKSYNLLGDLRTSPLKDGSNVVRDLGNGLKAIAQVNKGQISQWLLQDRTGKQYLPKSTERKAQQSFRAGYGWGTVWVFCYYTPWGWYCIWIIWY